MRKIILVILITISMVFVASTAAHASSYRPGAAALNWAESQTGKPYGWGGIGPWSYDCSGLVYEAFHRVGITLPRTTYGMLGSWHLVRTYHPHRGDLAFFSSGHVEFVTKWYETTFGAQNTGTLVGWHRWYSNSWWRPTAFYSVR